MKIHEEDERQNKQEEREKGESMATRVARKVGYKAAAADTATQGRDCRSSRDNRLGNGWGWL